MKKRFVLPAITSLALLSEPNALYNEAGLPFIKDSLQTSESTFEFPALRAAVRQENIDAQFNEFLRNNELDIELNVFKRFMEFAIGREIANQNIGETVFDSIATMLNQNPSVGPLQIRGSTFLKAEIKQRTGEVLTNQDAEARWELLAKPQKEKILAVLYQEDEALIVAFLSVLSFYLPAKNEDLLFYSETLDMAEVENLEGATHTLETSLGTHLVNADELRLTVALAKYQGARLHFKTGLINSDGNSDSNQLQIQPEEALLIVAAKNSLP